MERSLDFTIFITNPPADSRGHVPHLIAEVVGPSPDFEGVKDHFQEALAHRLDALSLVTRCRFRISHCIRVLEWEPYQSNRKMWIIHQQDAYDPPAPNLVAEFVMTAAHIFKAVAQQPILARPVQCFRYGLLAEQPEEQFQYFWSALENLAEATKTRDQVNVTCPQCNSDVYCNQCNANPVRRKVATEEMKAILVGLSRDGEAIFKTLQKVRNHLSHGRSPYTVQDEAKIPLANAVDLMAQGAWRAIMRHIPPGANDVVAPETSVVPLFQVVTADVSITLPPGIEHPNDQQIGGPTISLQTRFGDPNGGSAPSS